MSKLLRILLVEDSEDDASLLVGQLRRHGYEPIYEQVETAQAMSEALSRQEWDIVISDYVLPQFSGLEALKISQTQKPDIPCIIMSGKITDETAVAAMKAGAQDYIMKDNLKRIGQVIERELLEAKTRREHALAEKQIKLAEKELRESNEFNASMMRNAPNPIVVFNRNRIIRYVNPALEELTGFFGRELVGTSPPFPWWAAEQRNLHEFQFCKAHGKLIRGVEKCFVKKSGEYFWVDVTSIPIKDDRGKLLYVLGSWIDITEQKRLNEQMEYYIRKVTEAQEQERSRIARELHDETAQSLALLTLELDSILHHNGNLPDDIIRRLQQIRDNTNLAMEEVRRFSHELRPGVLDHLGLLAAIDQIIEENNANAGLKIDFEVTGDEKRFSPDVELALFRIIQESLNNVRKHSQATHASVKLDFDKDHIRLVICDNGKGFSKKIEGQAIQQGHLGLIGMKERARLIGAGLKLDSKPGKGTTIILELGG